MLMLALIVLPVAEKAHHEWGHLSEDHCGSEGLHYCETEHHCETCDFIFAANIHPPDAQEVEAVFFSIFHDLAPSTVDRTAERENLGFFLRGPPPTA